MKSTTTLHRLLELPAGIGCLVVLCLFGLHSQPAQAQHQKTPLELRTDSLLHALRAQGVDTICVYEDFCVGCRGGRILDDSPCASKGLFVPTYVFWKHLGKTYRRYLDNCQLQPAQNINTALWAYFEKHSDRIRTEEINDFHVLERDDTKPSQVTRNHGGHYSYALLIQQDTISHYYDDFALQKSTRMGNRKLRNIYYRLNRRSPVYRFQQHLAKAATARR